MKLKNWLEQGPFTLSLSSGFFGFYCHLGFTKALRDSGFEPEKYRGCSAGAIVSSALASGQSIEQLETTLTSTTRDDFWDPGFGFGLLRGKRFLTLLEQQTQSDFSKLKKPLTLSVFELGSLKTKSIESGPLPETVWASCAVPLMFQPARINKRKYWDGGIFDPLAIHGIKHDERILIHDITDQSNWGMKPKIAHLQDAKLIRLSSISKCGPNKMHLGNTIIDQAYQQTMGLLQS